ncbi:hypothetical protein D2V17_14360 [Aurantiacibacter xanthus]|uniref:LexA repressor DNA-binding domain-containing protein n=1 Tax=Aurantiacibacter xanthus TaxID=1784712 RepID=A0A3A1P6L8_9SPHN|nr:hypothetical protein [Aurantiacibacter xanthus]RIV82981.1 hypothetical protein D2V17_14360 [Aurantiacibacter xanthus]
MLGATPRQYDLLRYIVGYIGAHGYGPSFVEMAAGVGVKGKGAVHRLLTGLEDRGLILRRHGSSRAITPLHVPAIPRTPDGAPLQVVKLEYFA